MARYRVIYMLYFDLGQPPGGKPGSSMALCVPLDRHGMPYGPGGNSNGRPRPPKRRTIDLRSGDEILCSGRWQTIRGVTAYRANDLTEAQAIAHQGDCGYVYAWWSLRLISRDARDCGAANSTDAGDRK